MGLFDFFRRKTADEAPKEPAWDALDAKTRVERIVLPLLERVGARAGFAEARARRVGDGESAELVGAIDGMPCRVFVSWSGGVELEVRYDEELSLLDLEYDPEAAVDAASWDKRDRRVALAPGVFVDDVKARKALDALPSDLRTGIVDAMPLHRIRYFRSRPGATTIDLLGDLPELAAPEASVCALLRLAVDTAKARGATPSPLPGAPVSPAKPFAGWTHLGQEEKWDRAVAFANGIAARVRGETRADREALEIEVRWTEGGVPLRVELDLGFLYVKPGALAKAVDGTLDLFWDATLVVREDIGSGAWEDEDDVVFLAPSILLRGDEHEVRAQMSLVEAIPAPLRTELYEAMVRHRLAWVNLDDGLLDAKLADWSKTDDGSAAIEIARLFGRIVATLPRGARSPTRDRVVRCKFCRALWFPNESRVTCTHCGAPPVEP